MLWGFWGLRPSVYGLACWIVLGLNVSSMQEHNLTCEYKHLRVCAKMCIGVGVRAR